MPELPEVETIKRGLNKFILKKKIRKVEIREKKSLILELPTGRLTGHVDEKDMGSIGELSKKLSFLLRNSSVKNLRRFGKALVIDLDNGLSLMIHLRMTGQLVFDLPDSVPGSSRPSSRGSDPNSRQQAPKCPESGNQRLFSGGHPTDDFVNKMPSKHTRVIFEFENGTLYFNDQRKFGFVKVLKTAEVEKDEFIRKLGKEPWAMEPNELYEKLQRHKNAPVKAVILDQTIIAGLGNIYADESLFFAGVRPDRKAGAVTEKEAEQILVGARKVMEASIASGGSTMATYVRADGTKGNYLEKFAQVFRREGKACPKCGAKIKKMRVAGRGTHFCEHCQK